MARITYGTIVTNIKGSIGGTTFSTNRAGAIAKARVVGKRKLTPGQSVSLSSSMSVTNAWNELSYAEKVAFNDYALVNTFTDRFGNVKTLTGYQWYKQLAAASYYLDGTYISVPPAYSFPSALPSFEVLSQAGVLQVTWSTPIDSGVTGIYVYATPPIRGVANNQSATYRLLDTRSLDITSSFDLAAVWSQVFGIDLGSLPASSRFNVNILIMPLDKSSYVSGVAQFNTSEYTETAGGIGIMEIGSTFIIG